MSQQVSARHIELLAQVCNLEQTENDLAQVYARAILSNDAGINWLDINAAIIERSSRTALVRVKERAWKLVEKAQADAKRPMFTNEELKAVLAELLFPTESIDNIPSRWFILATIIRDRVEDKLLGKRGF